MVEEFESMGGIYIGEKKDGLRHGYGTFLTKYGEYYEGEYRNGFYHGKGYFKSEDGDKYIGEWVDGEMQGHGIGTWANGDVYIGKFYGGELNGKGKIIYSNGDILVGTWFYSQKEGFMTRYIKNGKKHYEKWENDVQIFSKEIMDESGLCPICLESTILVKNIYDCKHNYCKLCIKHLNNKSMEKCPTCRSDKLI